MGINSHQDFLKKFKTVLEIRRVAQIQIVDEPKQQSNGTGEISNVLEHDDTLNNDPYIFWWIGGICTLMFDDVDPKGCHIQFALGIIKVHILNHRTKRDMLLSIRCHVLNRFIFLSLLPSLAFVFLLHLFLTSVMGNRFSLVMSIRFSLVMSIK